MIKESVVFQYARNNYVAMMLIPEKMRSYVYSSFIPVHIFVKHYFGKLGYKNEGKIFTIFENGY